MPANLMRLVTHALAAFAALLLLIFNLRRLIFLLVAAWDWRASQRLAVSGKQLTETAHRSPLTVLLLVPLRNEAATIPGLLDSLLALDYPANRLTIGLIDDGSSDETTGLVDAAAAGHTHVEALHSPDSLGKAAALNAGLRRWPTGEIVAVYDADARPEPASLRRLAAAFDDPAVAAAGGLIRPVNGLASPAAAYSAIERLVHQQVTQRAKDRLRLAPAILGSHCAYRRSDLEAAGGFPAGALLEDSHLTVALARSGRLIRFLPDAVAWDQVPETLAGYWRQHVRWGRGFYDVAAGAPSVPGDAPLTYAAPGEPFDRSPSRAPASLLRLELRLFSLGYLDRLALLLAGALLAIHRLHPAGLARRRHGEAPASLQVLAGLVGMNLALPYAQIALALVIERAGAAWWLRLPLVPCFFAVDVAAAVWSALLSLARRPQVWTPTERALAGALGYDVR